MAATLGSTARTRIVNKNQKKKTTIPIFFQMFCSLYLGTMVYYSTQVVLLWGNGHYTCTLLRTRYLQTKTTYMYVCTVHLPRLPVNRSLFSSEQLQ